MHIDESSRGGSPRTVKTLQRTQMNVEECFTLFSTRGYQSYGSCHLLFAWKDRVHLFTYAHQFKECFPTTRWLYWSRETSTSSNLFLKCFQSCQSRPKRKPCATQKPLKIGMFASRQSVKVTPPQRPALRLLDELYRLIIEFLIVFSFSFFFCVCSAIRGIPKKMKSRTKFRTYLLAGVFHKKLLID